MKKLVLFALVVSCLSLVVSYAAQAAVPLKMNIQGKLTEKIENTQAYAPVNGTKKASFGFYRGNIKVSSNDDVSIDFNNGVFSKDLDIQDIDNFHPLTVKVTVGGVDLPEQNITSVPYAFHAQNAYNAYNADNSDKLGGLSVTSFATKDAQGNIIGAGVGDYVKKAGDMMVGSLEIDASKAVGGGNLTDQCIYGKANKKAIEGSIFVGGTLNPEKAIGVLGKRVESQYYGVWGYTANDTGIGYGVYGNCASSVGGKAGVYGSIGSGAGAGKGGVIGTVGNVALSSDPEYRNFGVYGHSVNGYGVYGKGFYGVAGKPTNSLGGGVVGVDYESNMLNDYSPDPKKFGVFGRGKNYGVYGEGDSIVGVYGESKNAYGVQGVGATIGGSFEGTGINSKGIYASGHICGGEFVSSKASGTAVHAVALGGAGVGVYGEGAKAGGVFVSTTGRAVDAANSSDINATIVLGNFGGGPALGIGVGKINIVSSSGLGTSQKPVASVVGNFEISGIDGAAKGHILYNKYITTGSIILLTVKEYDAYPSVICSLSDQQSGHVQVNVRSLAQQPDNGKVYYMIIN